MSNMQDIPDYNFRSICCEEKHNENLDIRCCNAIRAVSAACATNANSGHPGAPMGCALIAHALFGYIMNYSNDNTWIARDRFVLSNGHACALLYTMLYLIGYIQLDDLKSFRKLHSITPGHPENHLTRGVEVTTGPLGQGVGQAVGLAIAARIMSTNSPELFNNRIYCLCGDGCLNEGVALEAISIAGNQKLSNLTLIYDRNGITIDGVTKLAFTESIAKIFNGYNWNVLYVPNGDCDLKGIIKAIEESKTSDQPTLIIVDTTIGYGSKMQGTKDIHGSPITLDDLLHVRKLFNLTNDNIFEFPEDVINFYKFVLERNTQKYNKWMNDFVKYEAKNKTLYNFISELSSHTLDSSIVEMLDKLAGNMKEGAGRASSEVVLKEICKHTKKIIGGSADLMESNKTNVIDFVDGIQSVENKLGRYIHFGVREHAMVAITNGICAYGGFRPFCATFLNFFSYGLGALRLSALSKLPVLFIATHDSIELAEDGPTHQPIEVIALYRAMPNMILIRPGDAKEVVGAYQVWIENNSIPTMLALSRGKIPLLTQTNNKLVRKGAYILSDFDTSNGKKKLILASSGSELHIALETKELLKEKYCIRVISFPSWNLFEKQTKEYKNSLFEPTVPAALMEPYSEYGISKYFREDLSVTLNTFGYSGKAIHIYEALGFTAEQWAKKIITNY